MTATDFTVLLAHPLSTTRIGTERAQSLQDALNAIAKRWVKNHPNGYIPSVEQVGPKSVSGRIKFRICEIIVFSNPAMADEATAITELFTEPKS